LQSYFVWYRVSRDDRDTEIALRSMMARLACRSGVCGRLLKKRDEPGLWMEIYADVAEPLRFEHLLRQAVDEFDVEMFIDGARRTECFDAGESDVAACA
jgi:hypothetical protein